MAFTKYASLESAQVLGIKGSHERARTASLDKFADFEDFRTEDGYLYARIRAISSRVNKNHDGWPSIELAGGEEAFQRFANQLKTSSVVVAADSDAKYGYSTFLAKPIFVDHHNSNPERARGVIVDSKLHVEDHKTASELDPYYASAPDNHTPPTWVELLLEVDAKSFPKLAAAIIEGSEDSGKGIDGFSMGCDVEYSKCSHCSNKATSPDQYCEHVRLKGAEFPYTDRNGKTSSRKSYEDCYGIKFFEISAVFDPADETALLREVRAHTAAEHYPEEFTEDGKYWDQMQSCPGCEGSGRLSDPSNPEGSWSPCPACEGSGALSYDAPPAGMNIPGMTPQGEGYSAPTQLAPEDVTMDSANESYNGPIYHGHTSSTHTAEAPPPQVDELKMPEKVDTLREETICPVCGSDMDEETCDVCGFQQPPEGFDNPDLSAAGGPELPEQGGPEAPEHDEQFGGPVTPEEPGTSNSPTIAHVNNDMSWSVETTAKTSYTNPATETPVVPNAGPATDEPKDAVVKQDHAQPVTSKVRTAEDFIAAAGAQRRTMPEKTADAASGAPEVATPDVNVDADAVGGITEATNEEASKADAQIDVEGQGTTGVSDVSADKTESVDQGDEHSKNIEEIPTKTWGNGSGVEKQRDPVGGDKYPAEGGVTSSWEVTALDDSPYPAEDGGLGGGGANQGTEPVDAVGKPDERVDVLDSVTSPSNNSGETKTWSGTDGNGVTRQQEPVTTETLEGNDIVNLSPSTSSVHIFAAMKLADKEVKLGLTSEDAKFERAAELEKLSPEELQAESRVVDRVKTAGLAKAGQHTAKRMPSLGRNASVEKESKEETPDEFVTDSSLFLN